MSWLVGVRVDDNPLAHQTEREASDAGRGGWGKKKGEASHLLKQSPDILQLDLLEVDLVLLTQRWRESGTGFQECEESATMAGKRWQTRTLSYKSSALS